MNQTPQLLFQPGSESMTNVGDETVKRSADSSRSAPAGETSSGSAEHLSQNGDKQPGEAVVGTVQLNGERPVGVAGGSVGGCDRNGRTDYSESHLPTENGTGTSSSEPEGSSQVLEALPRFTRVTAPSVETRTEWAAPADGAVEHSAVSAPNSDPYRELDIYDAFGFDLNELNEPSQSEESSEVQPEDTNPIDELQKRWKDLEQHSTNSDVCSFCDQTINGKIKLILSHPALTCHPECLKCGVCATVLGELLIPMFLLGHVVHCKGCFSAALST